MYDEFSKDEISFAYLVHLVKYNNGFRKSF